MTVIMQFFEKSSRFTQPHHSHAALDISTVITNYKPQTTQLKSSHFFPLPFAYYIFFYLPPLTTVNPST
ncbi:hypothetical protein L1887_41793 [Cichorium endivia]|nr:hypothetical protein L1887_41793 [Cichorium endivia]